MGGPGSLGVGSMASVGGVGGGGNPPLVGCASTCDRRMRAHHEQSALSPACSASLAHLHLHAGTPSYPVPGGDVYACAARDRERGHYVAYEPLGHYNHRDSLSSDVPQSSTPAPPLPSGGPMGPLGGPHTMGGQLPPQSTVGGSLPRRPLHSFSDSDHSTPTHSNRSARESSPYKKSAASSPAHHSNTTNRLHLGSSVPHCESELEPLTPSRSTERLQREMQNLEGLMKDLSAITQHQFHC